MPIVVKLQQGTVSADCDDPFLSSCPMSEFSLYFSLGLDHILDINGYDHILFVVALCAVYSWWDWKKVLLLVTAFTIGHSITLALATLKIVSLPSDFIEFLIPVTILITALSNLFVKERHLKSGKAGRNIFYAAFFGLIHGLGFSNYLRALLGEDESIISQLFAFNVGLEVGQIIIVAVLLLFNVLLISVFGVSKRDWRMVMSAAVAGIAFTLLVQTSYLTG